MAIELLAYEQALGESERKKRKAKRAYENERKNSFFALANYLFPSSPRVRQLPRYLMGWGWGGWRIRVATRMGRPNKISATNSAEKLYFLLSPFEKKTTAAQANTAGLSVFYVFSMTKKYSPIFLFSRDQERENIDKSDFLSVLLNSSRITIIEVCTGYIHDHVFLSRQ